MERETLVVEAALFSAGKALSAKDIAEATGLEDGAVRKALKKLTRLYSTRETSIEIQKIGPKYHMRIRDDFTEDAKEVSPTDIDPQLVRSLSLIAYYQPMAQSRLQEMVGPRAYTHVKELVKMGFVISKAKGRTKSLSTTKLFLERFGINAKTPEEIRAAMEKMME